MMNTHTKLIALEDALRKMIDRDLHDEEARGISWNTIAAALELLESTGPETPPQVIDAMRSAP